MDRDTRAARFIAFLTGITLLIAAAALVVLLLGRTSPAPASDTGRREGFYTLLIGGTDTDGTRTDTILLCAVDTKAGTLDIMSIPRDTRAYTADGKVHKINAAHNKGIGRMRTEIENTVGFSPDRCCIIDYAVFETVIDAIGGVTVDVGMDMDYTDASQGLEIHLQAGEQVLDGAKALQYMRFRSGYPDADLGRIRAQQKLMAAVAKKLMTPRSLLLLPKIPEILRQTETDLTVGETVWLAARIFAFWRAKNVTIWTLPGQPVGADFGADAEKTLELVNSRFNPYTEPIEALNIP